MSATGSVMVMAGWPSSRRFPSVGQHSAVKHRDLRRGRWATTSPRLIFSYRALARPMLSPKRRRLPAGLGDAGQFTAVGHRPEADPAQAEPAVHRPRAPAP